MVNNIGSCGSGSVGGLRQEVENLKGRLGPTEEEVRTLRAALDDAQGLERFHREGKVPPKH